MIGKSACHQQECFYYRMNFASRACVEMTRAHRVALIVGMVVSVVVVAGT